MEHLLYTYLENKMISLQKKNRLYYHPKTKIIYHGTVSKHISCAWMYLPNQPPFWEAGTHFSPAFRSCAGVLDLRGLDSEIWPHTSMKQKTSQKPCQNSKTTIESTYLCFVFFESNGSVPTIGCKMAPSCRGRKTVFMEHSDGWPDWKDVQSRPWLLVFHSHSYTPPPVYLVL